MSSDDRFQQFLVAVFAADSFSLSTHWEYQTEVIAKTFGTIEDTVKPTLNDYHKTKNAGDNSHIGDTSLFLLENIAQNRSFNINSWRDYFVHQWSHHNAYLDHATKGTIANLEAGKTGIEAASDDDDLGHSSQFFPLLGLYPNDEAGLVKAAVEMTQFQQSNTKCASTVEFLAHVLHRVYYRAAVPSVAMKEVSSELKNEWVTTQVNRGLASIEQDDLAAYRSFGDVKTFDTPNGKKTIYLGLSCSVDYGLSEVVHSVAKYEASPDPSLAIIKDVNIGGNTVSRCIAIAAILFAHRGVKFAPLQRWVSTLKSKQHIISQAIKVTGN